MNILSVLDPGALVAEPHRLRLPLRGHELLSIIFRYAQILLSTLDPASAVFSFRKS